MHKDFICYLISAVSLSTSPLLVNIIRHGHLIITDWSRLKKSLVTP